MVSRAGFFQVQYINPIKETTVSPQNKKLQEATY